jgi:hypothetical protein
MTTVERLALRVDFQDEEPAYGTFCRLAARAGFDDARDFSARVGVPFNHIFSGRRRNAVEVMAGLSIGSLSASTPVRQRSLVFARGQTLFNHDWIGRQARICPICIHDDLLQNNSEIFAYRRFWWDYRAIDTCPRHGVFLENSCRRCRTEFYPYQTNYAVCQCGTDLRGAEPLLASEELVHIDDYLLARLLGLPRRKFGFLDDVPLESVLDTLFAIGASSEIDSGWLRGLSEVDRQMSKIRGASVLERWPSGFYDILDRFRAKSGGSEAGSKHNRGGSYTRYHSMLVDSMQHNSQAPIRAAFAVHFDKNVPANGRTSYFGRQAADTRHITLQSANLACGLPSNSRRLLPILFDLGQIKSGQEIASVSVLRDIIPNVREILNNSLKICEAMKQFGLSPTGIESLMDYGHIIAHRNEYDKSYRIDTNSLNMLVSELAQGVDRAPEAGDELLSLNDLARVWSDGRIIGLDGAIAAVRSGAIRVVARHPDRIGLAAIMVARASSIEVKISHGQTVARKRAARMLRVAEDDLPILARLGILRRSGTGNGLKSSYEEAQLKYFADHYTNLRRCSHIARTTPRKMAAAFDAHGIVPVASPPQTEATYYLWTSELRLIIDNLSQMRGRAGKL